MDAKLKKRYGLLTGGVQLRRCFDCGKGAAMVSGPNHEIASIPRGIAFSLYAVMCLIDDVHDWSRIEKVLCLKCRADHAKQSEVYARKL